MRFHALVSVFSFAASVVSAESFDAYGTGHGISKNVTHVISESLIVIEARTEYDRFEVNDPSNPLASVTGPCFGSIMIKARQVSGGGYCHYTDADGELAIISWTPQAVSAEGQTMGIWSVEGGTGKWDGASGGGAFSAGEDASGAYSNSVKGAITLP